MQAGWGKCAGDVCKKTARPPFWPLARPLETKRASRPAPGCWDPLPAKEQRPCGTLHPHPGDPPPPSSSRPELASAASLAVPATV